MKRKLSVASVLLAGSMVFMNGAFADDAIFGALLGGSAGVLVGQAVGGRDGAIVGGALGAVAGAVIATDDDDEHRGSRRSHAHGHAYAAQPRVVGYEPRTVMEYERQTVVEYEPRVVVVERDEHNGARHRYYADRHHRDEERFRERHRDHDGDRCEYSGRNPDHHGYRTVRYRD